MPRCDGIVVIGDSPVIRHNRSQNNGLAGVRILDFISLTGNEIAAAPFLDNNILDGKKLNEPTRGEYRMREFERRP